MIKSRKDTINSDKIRTFARRNNILKDEKRYGITFNNSTYFTDEIIKDLLNTLVIE